MKIIIKLAFALFIILVLLLSIGYWLLFSHTPNTVPLHQVNSAYATQSKQALQRLYKAVQQPNDTTAITVYQPELNGFSALLHRAFPQVTVNTILSDSGAYIDATVKVDSFIGTRFLNISTMLQPSNNSVRLSGLTIGALTIPEYGSIKLITMILNYYGGDAFGEKALRSIRSISITKQKVVVNLSLAESLLNSTNKQTLLAKIRNDLALFGDVDKIKRYYQSLVVFARGQPVKNDLAVFLNHQFSLASIRSSVSGASAIDENRAALAALVMYFGSNKFEYITGEVSQLTWMQGIKRKRVAANTSLRHRVDLQQHFIYSIALQLLSNQQASDAVGEFKELLDADEGGSGFSFADLMADRAGTRLAQIALFSEQQAIDIQWLLSGITDDMLLPPIDGLVEGVNHLEFSHRYDSVTSNEYQQALANIDERLKRLPLYQFTW